MIRKLRAGQQSLALAWLLLSVDALAASNFLHLNSPGSFAAGLKIVKQYDYTRSYAGQADPFTGEPILRERARPLQTLIWYPAEVNSGVATTLADYLALRASEEVFDPSVNAALSIVKAQIDHLPASRGAEEISQPMRAFVDASPAPGAFPLVIYAPSLSGSAGENADLCEYLASQGFVVLSSSSAGARPGGMTQDVEGLEAQVGDIEYLIGFSKTIPQVDSTRIAVIGYSWGGMANVFAAAKDARVTALVALDGSIRFFPNIVQEAGYLKSSQVVAPLLYLGSQREVDDIPVPVGRTNSFVGNMRFADVANVTLFPMRHGDFASVGQRLHSDDGYADYDRQELSLAYAWMETYALNFLNAYLKGDKSSLSFLARKPIENLVPAHLLSSTFRRSEGERPTREAFAGKLREVGFEHAQDIYAEFKRRDADFTITETQLNEWGYRLMNNQHEAQAVAILELASKLYADSTNAFNSLGEAYRRDGKTELAIKAYRRSLALDPRNLDSEYSLKLMGGSDTRR